ncbi:MAG TPA: NACHT domain-containing protein [Pyrinomonadaceae bacterium]|jgi:FOG: WD40 repeat|nr:NACHT domain-containing protein [Pyrinomonadaceae bacterium]
MTNAIGLKKTTSRVVRVFVSSTFRDMHAERDRLNRFVFPELRSRCAKLGADFLGIDLRWGVTAEESRRRGSLSVCLDEIDRARPFFIGLLGERYGWVPPPDQLDVSTFEEIRHSATPEDASLLTTWYVLDETLDAPVYHLSADTTMPDDVLSRLLVCFESADIPGAGQSITEREFHYGALTSPSPYKAFFYLRRGEFLDNVHFPSSFRSVFVEADPDRRKKLDQLKAVIRSSQTVDDYDVQYAGLQVDLNLLKFRLSRADQKRFRDGVVQPDEWSKVSKYFQLSLLEHGTIRLKGLDAWGDSILQKLWSAIEEEHQKRTSRTRVRRPVCYDAQELFLQDRTRLFIGREDTLAKMFRYLDDGKANTPLVVTGQAGSGKSALLAEFAVRARKRMNAMVLPFFIGASAASTDLISGLRSIVEKLRVSLRLQIPVPSKPEELRLLLHRVIKALSSRKRLILLIDALDQLDPSSESHQLDWLPMKLPRNVRLIVSTLPGKTLDSLREQLKAESIVTLLPLSENDRRQLVSRLLQERGKKLTDEQVNELLNIRRRPDAALPLYLRVALEELSLFGDYASISARINELPTTLANLFAQVLIRLEADHGRELVECVLRWLGVSRAGLTEGEILDLLSIVMPNSTSLDWIHFYRALAFYLQPKDESSGEGLIGFYHQQLRLAANRRYLAIHRKKKSSRAFRRTNQEVARYFEGLARVASTWNSEQRRALSEIVYHQTQAELWNEVESTLCDLGFAEAKCRAGMTFELGADFSKAIQTLPEAQAEAIETAMNGENAQKYASELATYARACKQVLDRSAAHQETLEDLKYISLPTAPQASLWLSTSKPNTPPKTHGRLANLRAFAAFVAAENQSLDRWRLQSDFCLQQAHNDFDAGPVGRAADEVLKSRNIRPFSLLCRPKYRAQFDPEPIILRTLTAGSGDTSDMGQDTSGVAASADGTTAVSTFKTIMNVWDLVSGRRLRILDDDSGWVQAVAMTPDGRRLVSGSGDNIVRLWDVSTGTCLSRLNGHEGRPMTVAISASGELAVSAGQDGAVRVWDLERGVSLSVLRGHTDQIESVILSHDCRWAISGSNDTTIRLWDLAAKESIAVIRPRRGPVKALASTPDLRLLVIATEGACQTWNLVTRSKLNTLNSVEGPRTMQAEALAVSADGSMVALGHFGTVTFCDIETGSSVHQLWPPAGSVPAITQLALTADTRKVITVSYDGTVQVWDAGRGWHAPTEDESSSTGNVDQVAFRSDGRIAASCHDEGVVLSHDVKTGSQAYSEPRQADHPNAIAITPDGSRTLIATHRHFNIYKVSQGFLSKPTALKGYTGPVYALTISADGSTAVSGAQFSRDQKIRVWDLITGRRRSLLSGHRSGVKAAVLATDCRLLLSAGDDEFGKIHRPLMSWNLATQTRLRVFKATTDSIEVLALSEDGQYAVSGGLEATVSVWSVRSGVELRKLEGHSDEITGVSITADIRYVVSASRDRTVRVWDLLSGECLSVCVQPFVVLSLAMRGQHVIIGGQAGNVRLLDLVEWSNEPRVTTPVRIYDFVRGDWAKNVVAFCGWCDRSLKPPANILKTIEQLSAVLRSHQAPCLALDQKAFVDSRLESTCVYCKKPIRFNPFILDNSGSL